MVTARSGGALLRSEACSISARSLAVAAELGTLLQTRALIRDAHWRVSACIQLVPALIRLRVPLDRVRADVTRDVAEAICPEPLRPIVVAMLVAELCAPSPRLRVLELAVEALWSRGWAPAALAAASAAIASCKPACLLRDAADPLASNARKDLEAIRALVAERPVRSQVDALVRRGFVHEHGHGHAWGRFVGDVSTPRSEDAFEPSLPLVIAVADAICAEAEVTGTASASCPHGAMPAIAPIDRLRRLEALIRRLPSRLQPIGRAHLARVRLVVQGERAATSEVRSISTRSHRDAATLLLVRASLPLPRPGTRVFGHPDDIRMCPQDGQRPSETGTHTNSISRCPRDGQRMSEYRPHPDNIRMPLIDTPWCCQPRSTPRCGSAEPIGSAERCEHASRCGAVGAALAMASRFAEQIESSLVRQRAGLAIAQHLFAIGKPLRARRVMAKVTHPGLGFEHWQLHSAITIQLRPRAPGRMFSGNCDEAWREPVWAVLSDTSAPGQQLAAWATMTAMLVRLGTAEQVSSGKTSSFEIAAGELDRFAADRRARRLLLWLLDRARVDALAAVELMQRWGPRYRVDPLIAELIAMRASRLAGTLDELPQPMQDGLANRKPRLVVAVPTNARIDGRATPGFGGNARRHARLRRDGNPDARLVEELLGGQHDARVEQPTTQVGSAPSIAPADDRATIERALYDEGVALQADPEGRRRAIINAARACVRGAIERPDAWQPEVIAARLRTLTTLGGGLASDALEGALAIRPGTDRYVPELVRALCRIDRGAAARVALDRATRRRRDRDPHGTTTLRLVELHGGFVRGFADGWRAAKIAIGEALQSRDAARGWLAGLVAIHGVPSTELLEWIAQRATEARAHGATLTPTFPPTARALLDEARARAETIRYDWPQQAARRVADDGVLLDALLLDRPKLDAKAPKWSHGEWTKHLRRAASVATGVVDRALVSRCARRLGKPELERWLLAGDVAALGVERSREVGVLGLRVRLLDKRLDLLAYLRFADVPVWSCYRSDSRFYKGTRDDVIAVWKDPLSMCFRVERDDGRPWGFVFGGFAELEGGRIAITLNGLYLQRDSIEVRAPVLAAIENMLAPLGCAIGLGNQFGGEGPLPDPYRRRAMRGTRWRAVRIGADLVKDAYDDLSYEVNRSTELDLWWRL